MLQAAIQALIDLVRSHYAGSGEPLFLARAGQELGEHRKTLVDSFGTLRNAIKNIGPGILDVVAEPTRPERSVVVTPEVREAMEARVQASAPGGKAWGAQFKSLPFPVQVAFCLNTEAGEAVAVRISPPVRYQKLPAGEPPPAGFRLIEGKHRLPGLNINGATASDLERLWRNYLEWAEENKINPDRLTKSPAASNALERLLAAQETDVMARMVLPADIATILLRHN